MDRLWTNARLATMADDGLGLVEDGAIACRDGRIAYAGPRAGAPSDAAETIDCLLSPLVSDWLLDWSCIGV